MAPSAVETITSSTETKAKAKPSYKIYLEQYKELDTLYVDSDVEEGRNGAPAAKVCHQMLCHHHF